MQSFIEQSKSAAAAAAAPPPTPKSEARRLPWNPTSAVVTYEPSGSQILTDPSQHERAKAAARKYVTDHPDVQQHCDFPASELDNIPKWINDAANEWWNMILGKRKREQITSAGNGGRVSL